MKPDDIKTIVDIINSVITTLAILAAGWWFFLRRSLAGNVQITLTLTGTTMINNIRIAIIRVQMKNVGQTRVKKDYCAFAAEVIDVQPNSEPINTMEVGAIDYSLGQYIFRSLVELEPNEVSYQDVGVALTGKTFFQAGACFKRTLTKRKSITDEFWQTVAVFNADEKAKTPSNTDLPTEQLTRSE